MKELLIYLAGCATPLALFLGHAVICDLVAWVQFKRREPKKGTWIIHSHAGGGSDYYNGGRYTIYRYGHSDERPIWDPPMRTEQEALLECERRNPLP